MLTDIPTELRERRQWVCWRYLRTDYSAKPTKLPINPYNGSAASATDPSHWGDFKTCVNLASNPAYNLAGIGYVLAETDPYCFIDLDDPMGDQTEIERHHKIYSTMNSYSEYSPSGRGIHVIVRAQVLAGRKRSNVEIYSSGRYMTVTGAVCNKAPIVDRQAYVDILWDELGRNYAAYNSIGFVEQTASDREIWERAINSRNGEKFRMLWNGDWQNTINEKTGRPYPSQSEADLALINMLVFWTQSENQIRNLFLQSALGQRRKGHRVDYVNRMIKLAFDQTVPMIDFEKVNLQINQQVEAGKEAARVQPVSDEQGARAAVAAVQAANGVIYQGFPVVNTLELPPGLVGDLAQFIYAAAPRPVPEIALTGALGLMAGICGRSYNVSGTGLNLYLLLLAKTGVGKDQMKSGIDKLIAALRPVIPSIDTFIGPSSIQSGQAFKKQLSITPCFLSIIGEFDKFVIAMSDRYANSSMIGLRQDILEVYSRSGATSQYSGVAYSDTSKNIKPIYAPAFSILGEGTPERLYKELDENMISEGLLPRFLVVEYYGDRPYQNKGHTKVQPGSDLLNKLHHVVETSLLLQKGIDGKEHIQTIQLDAQAEKLGDDFNDYVDNEIRGNALEVKRELWNRAHLNWMRVGGVIAVGCNPAQPIITQPIAEWAMKFVQKNISNLVGHFDKGETGENIDKRQMADMRRILIEYPSLPEKNWKGYVISEKMHKLNVVPYSYINKKLASMASIRADKIKASAVPINRCIQVLIDTGELNEIHPNQLEQEFGTRAKAYRIVGINSDEG